MRDIDVTTVRMQLLFTYAGVVELNQDPYKLGRLKVRVPSVFGCTGTGAGYVGTNDLPWALPSGMPAGNSTDSGGFSQLPEIGDQVWVRFLDGEPEKPIWEWGMQTIDGGKKFKLHTYDPDTTGVGKPNRTIWTRYGHAIEFNLGSAILTTSLGYRVVITDATDAATLDGNIALTTARGNFIKLDDLDDTCTLNVTEDAFLNIGSGLTGLSDTFSWKTLSGNFDLKCGKDFTITSVGELNINSVDKLSIDSLTEINIGSESSVDINLTFKKLSLGESSTEPAVLGYRLTDWIEALYTWISTHTHTSADSGSPTSPPNQVTTSISPLPATLLSETVTVQN
jgi:hypothetical protein